MDKEIEKFINYLFTTYPHLTTIIKTFEECSAYDGSQGRAYLVKDQTKAINFDKFTPWVYGTNGSPCKSADSLSFNDNYVYLIEFKSGDPTTHPNKIQKLIDGVRGKINDSDATLSILYSGHGLGTTDRLSQRFYLVVDSKKMGIDPMLTTLASLSLKGNSNAKQRAIFTNVLPNLLSGVNHPNHFDDIGIWYSEIFGTYLSIHNISDIVCPSK